MFYPRISLGNQDKRLFALVYLVLKSITLRLVQFSQLGILQLNLSKADILYNGHLVMRGTFLKNRPITFKPSEKPLYSGQFFEHRMNILGKIYLLIAGTL